MKNHGGVDRIRNLISCYQREFMAKPSNYFRGVINGLMKAEEVISRMRIIPPAKIGRGRPKKTS